MIEASAHDCDQVAFLDAAEHRWVEELGGMNLYFVFKDGRLVTPELGTILEGVTRSSLLTLAKEHGLDVEERRISIDAWRGGVGSGDITEVFACGTAAVITPVGVHRWEGGEVGTDAAEAGPVANSLRQSLLDLQYGRAEDVHGWMRRLGWSSTGPPEAPVVHSRTAGPSHAAPDAERLGARRRRGGTWAA